MGVLGSVAAFGTYSAFTGTTTNSGNSFAAGTVVISDASGLGTALFNVTDQAPGHTTQKCIEIAYTGSLPATVHMFQSGASNGTKFQIQGRARLRPVEPRYARRLHGLHVDLDRVRERRPQHVRHRLHVRHGRSGERRRVVETTNVDYRITLQPKDDPIANAHTSAVSTGSFSFTWEAHSN